MYQHEREMKRDVRNAMALSELVRILRSEPCKVEAYARWLEKWTTEERNQAQKDLVKLITLERITGKELLPSD